MKACCDLSLRLHADDAGGEKRRLGIACALIAKPSLLFLDEPTTGLDAFAALNIMDHMALPRRAGPHHRCLHAPAAHRHLGHAAQGTLQSLHPLHPLLVPYAWPQ